MTAGAMSDSPKPRDVMILSLRVLGGTRSGVRFTRNSERLGFPLLGDPTWGVFRQTIECIRQPILNPKKKCI